MQEQEGNNNDEELITNSLNLIKSNTEINIEEWKNGKVDGKFTIKRKDFIVFEGNYEQGHPCGVLKYWDEKEGLILEKFYEEKKLYKVQHYKKENLYLITYWENGVCTNYDFMQDISEVKYGHRSQSSFSADFSTCYISYCHDFKPSPDEISKCKEVTYLRIKGGDTLDFSKIFPLFPNLKRLLIRSSGISFLPSELSNFSKLEELYISSNLVELPLGLEKLTNLKSIHLYSTDLIVLPETIGNLRNLELLNISRSYIEQLPESIGNLVNLKKLIINNSKLKSIPSSLNNCQQLAELNLASNQIMVLPEELGTLNLEKLSINLNFLIQLPISIGKLGTLQSLELTNNFLTELPLSIGNLRNLQTLDISANRLISIHQAISQLSNLIELNLNSNKLTDFPSMQKNDLIKLKSLKLNNNQLSTFPEIYLPQLTTLNLIGNQIRDVSFLSHFPVLRYLNLDHNTITHLTFLPIIDQLQNLSLKNNPIETVAPEYLNSKNQVIRHFLRDHTPKVKKPGKLCMLKTQEELNINITPEDPRITILEKFIDMIPLLDLAELWGGEAGASWKMIVPFKPETINLIDILSFFDNIEKIDEKDFFTGWYTHDDSEFNKDELDTRQNQLQKIITTLKQNLTNIQYYKLVCEFNNYSYIVIGTTSDDIWYGLTPEFKREQILLYSDPQKEEPNSKQIETLRQLIQPLVTNYPFFPKWLWPMDSVQIIDRAESTRDGLLERLLMSSNLLVKGRCRNEMFDQYSEENRALMYEDTKYRFKGEIITYKEISNQIEQLNSEFATKYPDADFFIYGNGSEYHVFTLLNTKENGTICLYVNAVFT